METKVQVKIIAAYNGHAIKQNGNVDINFKCAYDELVNSIQMIQMLNNDINVGVRLAEQKPIKLGVFRLKGLKVDHDGESIITLNSQVDFVETDNLNSIITNDKFEVRFTSVVETEEKEEE